MRKSVNYTLKTLNSIGLIKNRLKIILTSLYQEGVKRYAIVGKSDLALLVEITLKEIHGDDYEIVAMQDLSGDSNEDAILICRENDHRISLPSNTRSIDLIAELSRDHVPNIATPVSQ